MKEGSGNRINMGVERDLRYQIEEKGTRVFSVTKFRRERICG